jgi:cell division septum initiation protein DivIVA
MTFSDQMKDFLNQGAVKAQDLLGKAGEKAQTLGEKGVLMLEIKQLDSQAAKLLARLGNEVYARLAEQGATSVSAEDGPIKAIMAELSVVKAGIEKRKSQM